MTTSKWLLLCGIAWALMGGSAYAAHLFVTRYDDDGMITVNGQRTFIVGSYDFKKKDGTPPVPESLWELRDSGFNLVRVANETESEPVRKAGLMSWMSVGTISLDDPEKSAADLARRVSALRDSRALAFLETVDEPAWTWMKAEPRVPPEVLTRAYRIIKEADPNHLLFMNHAPTNLVKTLQAYNSGTDIVGCDIYPVNPGGLMHSYALFADGHQGDLNNEHISQVGEYADKMHQVVGPRRPLFMVLQAFAWETIIEGIPEGERREEKIQYPTYAQSRFMAFQSVIRGANGILYWGGYYTPASSQCWADLKRVTRELGDLQRPLSERKADVTIGVEYHEIGHSVDTGVQALAKEHNGKLYVLTCNADKNPCKATLSGFTGWNLCTALNEEREAGALPIENGAITDTWKRFDVHVYEFSK